MDKYDYVAEMKKDIEEYLRENPPKQYSDSDEMREELYEKMWVSDQITGNGSGSYTFSAWDAEEHICHNMDLLTDAIREFGASTDNLTSAEWCDVTIRCYLLGQVLEEVLESGWYDLYTGGDEDEQEGVD